MPHRRGNSGWRTPLFTYINIGTKFYADGAKLLSTPPSPSMFRYRMIPSAHERWACCRRLHTTSPPVLVVISQRTSTVPRREDGKKKKHVFSGYKGASRIYRRASPEMRTLSICIILHNHPCITNGYRDDVGSAGWALGRISNAQNISLNACVCVWVRAWLYQHSFGAVCTIRTVIAFASWWTIRVDAIYRIANLCFRIRCHISLLLVACVMFHD